MSEHARNDRLSLAYHRAVAERLVQDVSILERARRRVEGWREAGEVHPHYVRAWQRVLAQSAQDVADFLVEPGEEATALRQVSPFAGVLPARERWAIWRAHRGGSGDSRAA